MIPRRKLGCTNLEPLCPVICHRRQRCLYDWTVQRSRHASASLIARLKLGLNFCRRPADVYSRWVPGHKGGESETLIGKWFARSKKRSGVILATKVGMVAGADGKNLSARSIAEAAEASLKRLQTDYVDIYFSHKDDEATPLEETLNAYSKLIEQGKVRLIGASNYKGDRLRQALEPGEDRASRLRSASATLQPAGARRVRVRSRAGGV